MSSASSSRRIGSVDSETRTKLLDAAEKLLVEEGYAAVTTRRVGAAAGLKPQLVHYYFHSMDELFIELFRRGADRNLARLARAAEADPSLRNVWRLNMSARGGAFTTEMVALANHRKALRGEIAKYAEQFRAAQLELFTAAFKAEGIPAELMPPIVALLLVTGLSQVVSLEEQLDMTDGHRETVEWIETWLEQGPRS